MKKVYLAGPVTGLSQQEARFGWRQRFAYDLARSGAEATVLSPVRHNTPLHTKEKLYVKRDFLDIQESAVVVANFLNATQVSIGTVAELGYAYALGKPIVVIMEEYSVHAHPFVSEMADAVVSTESDAVAIVSSLVSTGV